MYVRCDGTDDGNGTVDRFQVRSRCTWIWWCRIPWDIEYTSADARVGPSHVARGLPLRRRRHLCHRRHRPYGLACHLRLPPPLRTERRSPAKSLAEQPEATFLHGTHLFIRNTCIIVGSKEESSVCCAEEAVAGAGSHVRSCIRIGHSSRELGRTVVCALESDQWDGR